MKTARLALILLVGLWISPHTLIAGELSGRLTPPGRVTGVSLLNREGKRTTSARFDAETGEFLATRLPKGTYDVIIWIRQAHHPAFVPSSGRGEHVEGETDVGRIEGVNLRTSASNEQKPLTLTPGPVDRADLTDLLTWLGGKQPPADKTAPPVLGARLILTNRVVTEAFLCRADGDVKVKLTPEELAALTGTLTGTVMFFEVRDEVPMHAEVRLKLTDGQVRQVTIGRAVSGLAQADREWLINWVDKVKTFENRKRVLFIQGGEDWAKALVEKIRDEKTTLPTREPTVFWRVEIWNFRKLHGGWEKTDYDVVQRHKMSLREFRKLVWVFEPALGGFEVPDVGRTRIPDYRIPEKLDPDHGRTPSSQ